MDIKTDVVSEKVHNFNKSLKFSKRREAETKQPLKFVFQSTEHFTDDEGKPMVRRRIARKTSENEIKGKANIKAAKRAKVKAMKSNNSI